MKIVYENIKEMEIPSIKAMLSFAIKNYSTYPSIKDWLKIKEKFNAANTPKPITNVECSLCDSTGMRPVYTINDKEIFCFCDCPIGHNYAINNTNLQPISIIRSRFKLKEKYYE